jgi:ABC-type bacteriocin/lantibiotic exporter with double-glycine peptidase domain
MRINAYRSQVGQVLPEQMPFEGTIFENITFGNKDITLDTVNRIIKEIGLQEFVRTRPKGIDSPIFPQGQRIPHTVSKRILLARAIVHNPKILILKDALEHFEAKEARNLMEYLAHPDKPWLLIVSGQNENWKKVCNKHLRLNNGSFTL